eukprot:TRINITY_DN25999_c0_g1_i11.p1 TRINITY_DN25999_c0_g1~~TRINITY_DN25999_c0_g1_i11.p1  ORF type:complete len:158 (-),score=10.49 TRINITY_DN25999_c0_g1_i11:10-483(-)
MISLFLFLALIDAQNSEESVKPLGVTFFLSYSPPPTFQASFKNEISTVLDVDPSRIIYLQTNVSARPYYVRFGFFRDWAGVDSPSLTQDNLNDLFKAQVNTSTSPLRNATIGSQLNATAGVISSSPVVFVSCPDGSWEIGRAVQQECRDRSRMPSSA